MGGRIRCTFASAVAMAFFTWAASIAQAQPRSTFDLPVQPLANSLRAVGSQTNVNVLFDPPLVVDLEAPALKGEFTTNQAFTHLLVGTGISHEFMNGHTVVLAMAPAPSRGAGVQSSGAIPMRTSTESATAEPASFPNRDDGLWSRFRLAQADTTQRLAAAGPDSSSAAVAESSPAKLEEVLVTAQKRSERLQDVPVPVTAISAAALLGNNQLRIQDYYFTVPGLSVEPSYRGTPLLSIRGLTTSGGFTNPTVGVVIDDTPFGASTGLGGGGSIPDFDPSDLARVEVLRGPQGTLYGVGSIGGLFKFVTVDPSTDRVSARLQAGTSSVRNGDELGYNARGSINVPLSDSVAIRASGFARQDPGYIDDPALGLKGVNQRDVYGGRLSAFWRATDALSVKLSALIQNSKTDGASEVDLSPGLGDLEHSSRLNDVFVQNKNQAYSASVSADLGKTNLTSISGYSINVNDSLLDGSWAYGGFTGTVLGSPGAATAFTEHNKTTKFTQEIRFAAPLGSRVDWLLGVFYTHEDSPFVQRALGVQAPDGTLIGQGIEYNFPSTFREYAAFTDFTIHFTDRFDVQVGGRESRNRQTYSEVDTGPFVPAFYGLPSPVIQPEVTTRDSAFTYLLTPRFKIRSDLMVYARLASGYRVGGPNFSCSVFNLSCHVGPDKTLNYEIGAKGTVFNDALSFDVSLYDIEWQNMQIQIVDPVSLFTYFINAGDARSRGAELSLEARPAQGLTLGAWLAWSDAELIDSLPSGGSVRASAGDRLPFSARRSGHLSAEDEFPITSSLNGFVGGSLSYVGEREGRFVRSTAVRQRYPGYARVDLRAGVKRETWSVNLFVNNVLDRRGVLSGGTPAYSFLYIQPRTVGLSIAKTFD